MPLFIENPIVLHKNNVLYEKNMSFDKIYRKSMIPFHEVEDEMMTGLRTKDKKFSTFIYSH